ncbi:hypothetical protein [Streptomyces sp. NPDC059893]|uniref:hypothetical protein n=1 Tax=Streptomyces sp. NPDC059893 TaxID=3346990 RepID=UPI003651F105
MRMFQWAVVYCDDGRRGGQLAVWRCRLEPVAGGTAIRLRHGMRLGTAPGPLQNFMAQSPDCEGEILAGRFARLCTGVATTLADAQA